MSKNWKEIGLNDLTEGMEVRGQGYHKAFHAKVRSVCVDEKSREGMAVLDLYKKGETLKEKVEVFWDGKWVTTDKGDYSNMSIYIVDYSYLKGIAHNRLKIDRAREGRHLKFLQSEKGQIHQALEKERDELQSQLVRIEKILKYV